METGHSLVRVGGSGDGGYLVPDDLDGIEACFSPGVANTATFELEMARRGITSFLADYSVDGPPESHPMFRFEKKFLGPREDEVHVTLDGWVARCAPGSGDLVLQMDIEGAEWEVLLAASDATLRRFRVMVLELHDVHRAWERGGLQLMRAALGRLSAAGRAVLHGAIADVLAAERLGAVRGEPGGTLLPEVLAHLQLAGRAREWGAVVEAEQEALLALGNPAPVLGQAEVLLAQQPSVLAAAGVREVLAQLQAQAGNYEASLRLAGDVTGLAGRIAELGEQEVAALLTYLESAWSPSLIHSGYA
jgi:hypothetical protein